MNPSGIVSTFSIAAVDPATGDVGIAVASKILSVGAVVPWAATGVGAVATQAMANVTFGPRGLALLRKGMTARQVMDELVVEDRQRETRQFGVVDATGRAAAHTGGQCLPWAGHQTGKNYTVQGNLLKGPKVLTRMAKAFEKTHGELAERLFEALHTGDLAGGDRRGKQSAALLVLRKNGGYGGQNDRYVDLRVDDHHEPVKEIGRLLKAALAFGQLQMASGLVRDGHTGEALTALRRAARRFPRDAGVWYDYACTLTLAEIPRSAVRSLRVAVHLDSRLRSLAVTDPDLGPLRNRPDFRKVVGSAR